MFIQVCGAAREVTGSCYWWASGDTRFLVDCGMHQGGDKEDALNFEPLRLRPARDRFRGAHSRAHRPLGPVAPAGQEGLRRPHLRDSRHLDLVEIMLLDSAYIQEMEAEWQTRKAERAGRRGGGSRSMTQEDAAQDLAPVQAGRATPSANATGSGGDASRSTTPGTSWGRRSWSCSWKRAARRSGGVQRRRRPARAGRSSATPRPSIETDYLFMESTYGDRLHERQRRAGGSADARSSTRPSGAAATWSSRPSRWGGRRRCSTSCARSWTSEGLDMPIYVDSPLASRRHRDLSPAPGGLRRGGLEAGATSRAASSTSPSCTTRPAPTSPRALNDKKGVVIISASGMADAGRIRHHLKHNLWRPEAHVVIVGFQAKGTLGRRSAGGRAEVRIFGEEIAVKAHVHDLTGLSAHADQAQLLEWASHFKPPRLTLVTHGEAEASLTLAESAGDEAGLQRRWCPRRGRSSNWTEESPRSRQR